MTESEIREIVLRALREIAPETDAATVDPDEPIREQLDLDSMDFLNLLVALNEKLGVEIPEADYGRLDTLDRLVAYLARALGSAQARSGEAPGPPGEAPSRPGV